MNPYQFTLVHQLTTSQQRMIDLLMPLPDDRFFAPKHGKWSAAETLQHLYLSARTLPRLLTGPRAVLDQWPRSGRTSRSYETIATVYSHTLRTNGVTAPASFVARPGDLEVTKTELLDRFITTHQALADSLTNWSAGELDAYQLPHPALGLLTVGETMHFTAYHIEHHRAIEASLL